MTVLHELIAFCNGLSSILQRQRTTFVYYVNAFQHDQPAISVQNRHERQFLHDLLGPTRLKRNLRSQCKRGKTRAKTVVEYIVSGMSGFDEWRVDNLQALHGPTRSEMES